MNTVTVPKRPTDYDEAVTRAAVERMASRLEEEYPEDFPAAGREQVIADLLKAVPHAFGSDGYQIARALDTYCFWDIDAGMVEVLSEFAHDRWHCRDEAVQAWVIEHNVTPKLGVGSKLMLPARRLVGPKGGDTLVECEIVQIDPTLATYLLFSEAAGHVREGVGTHGVSIAFEDVEGQQ